MTAQQRSSELWSTALSCKHMLSENSSPDVPSLDTQSQTPMKKFSLVAIEVTPTIPASWALAYVDAHVSN
jgi:hypothetical protein